LTKKAEKMEHKAYLAHHRSKNKELGEKNKELQNSRISLAARLKAGDRQAAAELVDMYYQQVYLFMRRLDHSIQASEDLTQETFLHVWHHIGQLKNDKALKCWLYHIAGNVSKRHWRWSKIRQAASIEGLGIAVSGENKDKTEDFEQLERLQKAVEKLPRKQREVVVLHYMQHLTIAEAAEAVGVRKGTLKSRLNRALRALRGRIR